VLFVVMCLVGTSLLSFFAGPLSSGALFLLLPPRGSGVADEIPADYVPVHKGHVDLETGQYIRENEDLVVPGTPALVLRRSYLSGYRVPRQFGIGATHNGEEFVIGDSERFKWVAIVRADGARVNFRRISEGTSYSTAVYVHDETPTDWRGTKLGWVGFEWALRKPDGTVATYRGCGSNGDYNCGILRSSYPDGHSLYYRRDAGGRLLRMDDGGSRWIEFEYDDRDRIRRAHDSTGREARYAYDGRGRLTTVTATGGIVQRYSYTDQLATIEEPGTSIENTYANGRCVRQVNRYPDAEPYIFDFAYDVQNSGVFRTRVDRSDGTWTEYTWGPDRYPVTEVEGSKGYQPATFTFERDAATKAVTALTLTCPGRGGAPLRHSSFVRPGYEERIKWDLWQTYCFWRDVPRKPR
jgi:YD repeat-containing protein